MGLISLFFLVFCVSSSPTRLSAVLPLLDPGRITWWKTLWAPAPVVLSFNNAQATNVAATFYFSPSSAIVDGVLEVSFPRDFLVGGKSGAVIQITQQTYNSGEDYQVTVSGVTNPLVQGGYGPFALRTRKNPTGQQIDANLLFASVYIDSPAKLISSLQVLFSGPNINNIINKAGNTLAFKFQLSISLWRYDTFVIEASNYWTVGASPICVSAQVLGKANNYNGTNAGNSHYLDCVTTPKSLNQPQKIYIYGLAVDGIDLSDTPDSESLNLQITPVTTPSVAYFLSMFSWTVSTVRFGTNTVLETGTYTNGPAVAPDVITVAEWTPTWGLDKSDIQFNMRLYMDLSFTLPSSISSGGSAVLVVSEDVCSLYWGDGIDLVDQPPITCYVIDFLSETMTCSTSSKSTISIANLPELHTNSVIRIRNLVKIVSFQGAKAQILSINSYDSIGINIDTGSNLAPFTVSLGSPTVSAREFAVSLQDQSGGPLNKAGGTGDFSQFLSFSLAPANTPSLQLVASSKVTVKCPLSSSPSDFAIYVPHSQRTDMWVADTLDFTAPGSTVFNSLGVSSGSPIDLIEGTPGSISWSAGSSMLSIAQYLTFGLSVTSGPSFLTLPLISSNAATAYECYLRIEDTAAAGRLTTQVLSAQFKITPQDDSTIMQFSMMCSNNVAGAPGRLTFKPRVVDFRESTAERTYKLEAQFAIGVASGTTSIGFSSGLGNNDAYPHDCAVCKSSKAVLKVKGSRNAIQLEGLGPIRTTAVTPLEVFFPVSGVVVGNNLQTTIRSFYTLSSDPRLRFMTHECKSTLYTTTPTSSAKFVSLSSTGNFAISGESVASSGLKLVLKQSSLKAAAQWVYFVLPKGYRWTGEKRVVIDSPAPGSVFQQMYYFSSPSDLYAYPGVLVYTTNAGTMVSSSASSTITIYGYRLPKGKPYSPAYLTIVTGAGDGLLTSPCLNTSFTDVVMTASPGAIVGEQISPSIVASRGPDGIDVSHEVTLRLAHGLDANGFVLLTLDNNWATTPCTDCSVSGLSPLSNSQPLLCSYSGNVITVTQFADFSEATNVAVKISVRHLLSPDTPSSLPYDFVSTAVTRTSLAKGYLMVDQYVPGSGTGVIVMPTSAVGTPSWQDKQLYPSGGSLSRVSLYLRFALPHRLPKCGTIRLTAEQQSWRLPSGDIKNYCFFAPTEYQSCVLSGSELLITMDEESKAGTVFEVWVDAGVDSQGFGDKEQRAVVASAYWFTELIDADGPNLSSLQSFTPSYRPNPVPISALSLTVFPATVGETATYTFTFRDSVGLEPTHKYWVVFPQEYDYFIGLVSQTFQLDPLYYLPCSSPQFLMLTCTADHSVLMISSQGRLTDTDFIKIEVRNVVNPFVGRTGYLQLMHVNEKGECVAAQQRFSYVDLTAAPMKIDIRSVNSTTTGRGELSDLTFRVYLYDTLSPTSVLRVTFPAEFDLQRGYYICESTVMDMTKPASSRSKEVWTGAGECQTEGNSILLPKTEISKKLTDKQVLIVTVFNVTSPMWGWRRVSLSTGMDFDVWDQDVWELQDFWTSKFSLSLQSSSSLSSISSRSYYNLNSAYLGYSHLAQPLYASTTSEPLVLTAGTQSRDLNITTSGEQHPCEAKVLSFTPSGGGIIEVTPRADNFTIIQGGWMTRYRVAAGQGVQKGVYKVAWTVAETIQSGVPKPQYEPPLPVYIAVYPGSDLPVQIEVADIPQLAPGSRSPPIRVRLANSPHTDLSVNLHLLGAPRNVSVQPPTLRFKRDENEAYFQISVSKMYVSEFPLSAHRLLFNLSGTNSPSFLPPSPVNFTILEGLVLPTACILSLNLTTPGKTFIASRPAVTVPGTLYWWLAPAGALPPSFPDLKNSVNSLLLAPPMPAYMVAAAAMERNQTEPLYRETWVAFQKRLYRAHLNSQWKGTVAVETCRKEITVEFTWLWAGTSYTLLMYLDPFLRTSPSPPSLSTSFSTLPCPPPQPFRVKFQGYLIPAFTSKIANLAAKYQGVTPLRLFNGTQTLTSSRSLEGEYYSCFIYSLLPSRYAEEPRPEDQARIIGEDLIGFRKDLTDTLGIVNGLVAVSNDAAWNRRSAEWTVEPEVAAVTNNSVSVRLRASIPGSTCCSALALNESQPSPDQLFLGLTSYNALTPYACISTNTTNSTNVVKVAGLEMDTEYRLFCMATDDYPLWSTPMKWESVRNVTATTQFYNQSQVIEMISHSVLTASSFLLLYLS